MYPTTLKLLPLKSFYSKAPALFANNETFNRIHCELQLSTKSRGTANRRVNSLLQRANTTKHYEMDIRNIRFIPIVRCSYIHKMQYIFHIRNIIEYDAIMNNRYCTWRIPLSSPTFSIIVSSEVTKTSRIIVMNWTNIELCQQSALNSAIDSTAQFVSTEKNNLYERPHVCGGKHQPEDISPSWSFSNR